MADNKAMIDTEVLSKIVDLLRSLDHGDRQRVLDSVSMFYRLDNGAIGQPAILRTRSSPEQDSKERPSRVAFTIHESPSAKDFLLHKQPQTDIERVACLAYYLAHYSDTPTFKTIDISKLNTEAAQPKFSNTAYAVNNAVKAQIIVPHTKGARQLSALGERFVQALPDRDAARGILTSGRGKKRLMRYKQLN